MIVVIPLRTKAVLFDGCGGFSFPSGTSFNNPFLFEPANNLISRAASAFGSWMAGTDIDVGIAGTIQFEDSKSPRRASRPYRTAISSS